MAARHSIQRIISVARKEVLHIFRDRQTLLMTMFFPVVEMLMLGYAIDTNVRNIPTVYLDHCRTQESRDFLTRLEKTETFKFIGEARDEGELNHFIVMGKARVGVKIPEDFSRRLEAGDTAQVQVQVDGTVSSVAGEAVNAVNSVALRDSLIRVLNSRQLPIDSRPRILFNPDTRSANFFLPGLLVVLSQMMAVTLSANAIVRGKEKGTLEQLFMTPVRAGELIVGKLLPYLVLTFVEFCGITLLMRYGFQVPIHGSFVTLLMISIPFVLSMLAWGLWVSTRVETRDAAMQTAMATLVPCIFLSGYVFPLDSMPAPFYFLAQLIPTTWLIDAARGVILRGAGWAELWVHAAVLTGMAVVVLVYCSLKFHKQL